jgi:hypothetical protein
VWIIIGMSQSPSDLPALFKGRHFDRLISVEAVRRYLTYKVSYHASLLVVACVGIAAVIAAGGRKEIKWVHLSSKNGDLPRPGESTQQTGSLVADLDGDGDLDILNKPYNWEVPRVDVWLNNGTGTRRRN